MLQWRLGRLGLRFEERHGCHSRVTLRDYRALFLLSHHLFRRVLAEVSATCRPKDTMATPNIIIGEHSALFLPEFRV